MRWAPWNEYCLKNNDFGASAPDSPIMQIQLTTQGVFAMKASIGITSTSTTSTTLFTKVTSACVVAMAQLLLATSASATVIDLISPGAAYDSGTANGTIYTRIDEQPTGTGVFEPFLRIQGKNSSTPVGSEQGYNADYANASEPVYDEKVGIWTHSIQFSDLIYVNLDGIGYYEFLLDLDDPNDKKDATKRWISLNSVQIYTSPLELTAPYSNNLNSLGTKRYDMDVGADGDVTVNLDGARTSGNGQSDMAMYVLESNFAGVNASDYVTFYSYFGNPYYADGSFEEWSLRDCDVCQPPHDVSESSSLMLMVLGMLGLCAMRRRTAAV
jgi:hypothetical protein